MSETSHGAIISDIYEGIANGVVDNWATMKDTYSDIIDTELSVYNE